MVQYYKCWTHTEPDDLEFCFLPVVLLLNNVQRLKTTRFCVRKNYNFFFRGMLSQCQLSVKVRGMIEVWFILGLYRNVTDTMSLWKMEKKKKKNSGNDWRTVSALYKDLCVNCRSLPVNDCSLSVDVSA